MSSPEIPNIGSFEYSGRYNEFGRTFTHLRDPSLCIDLHLTADGINKLSTDDSFEDLVLQTAKTIVVASGFYDTNKIRDLQPGLDFVHESGYLKPESTAIYSDKTSNSIIKGTLQKKSRQYGIIPLSTMDRLATELALLPNDPPIHIGAAKQYALLVKGGRPTIIMEKVPGVNLDKFLIDLITEPSELDAGEVKAYVLDSISKSVQNLPKEIRRRLNDVSKNHLGNILIDGNTVPGSRIKINLIDQPNMDPLASAGFMATSALTRIIRKH